jgi:hypothetical protein
MAAGRNVEMAARIEEAGSAADGAPVSFVVLGDSGAWPDPTADAILSALLRQAAALDPAPLFLANLGDFAGPGTAGRHAHYLRLIDGLGLPDVCIAGNHDLEAPGARAAWTAVHGPCRFTFAAGHTRFAALDAVPEETPEGTRGPGPEALAFLDATLRDAAEPHRVVLMHCPPHLGGRFAPHPQWGFSLGERAFLDLLGDHRVGLVCCAHALFFDTFEHDAVRFVVSGGGGTALCSHVNGVCAPGAGLPADRGSLFHAVHLTVGAGGGISGRVLQAFDAPGRARFAFG